MANADHREAVRAVKESKEAITVVRRFSAHGIQNQHCVLPTQDYTFEMTRMLSVSAKEASCTPIGHGYSVCCQLCTPHGSHHSSSTRGTQLLSPRQQQRQYVVIITLWVVFSYCGKFSYNYTHNWLIITLGFNLMCNVCGCVDVCPLHHMYMYLSLRPRIPL